MPSFDRSDFGTPSNGPGGSVPSRLGLARAAAAEAAATPLGSLTQHKPSDLAGCAECGSVSTSRIALTLTDGTPVDFISCHVCANKSWMSDGVELELAEVLNRARKVS